MVRRNAAKVARQVLTSISRLSDAGFDSAGPEAMTARCSGNFRGRGLKVIRRKATEAHKPDRKLSGLSRL
jgi:hypothetical protein